MDNDAFRAQIAANNDAKKDINKLLWFVAGIFGNIFGIIIAAIYEPTPTATRLIDYSQEYIAYYTENYKIKGKNIQQFWATIGFCSQIVFIILLFILMNQYD